MGALPNLVLIGAPKCGTTALHYYLDLHPQSSMSRPKELNFFFDELDRRDLPEASLALVERNESNWHRGIDWYGGHFSSAARTNLKPFLDHYAASRVMVVDQDDLLHRRRETVRAVFRFAGLDESFWSPNMDREPNRSQPMGARHRLMFRLRRKRMMRFGFRLPSDIRWAVERLAGAGSSNARPVLDPGLRAELEASFREEAESLRAFCGKSFDGWSV